MSRILSILLIGLYGLTLSQAYMPHVNYWMNRDFIASELCENKDRPELQCEGKCHLKKEIRQSEQQSKEGSTVAPRFMVEYFQTSSEFSMLVLDVEVTNSFLLYTDPVLAGYQHSIFHPPKA